MSLRDLQLEGLSGLSLKNLSLSRDRNLTSIFTEAILDAPYLLLTGIYNMEGTAKESLLSYLLPDISSEGDQEFSINITRARIRADLQVELVGGCDETGNVSPVVTKIEFPFSYRDLEFKFDNLGSTVAAAVEGLGGWVIEYQRSLLVNLIRYSTTTNNPTILFFFSSENILGVRWLPSCAHPTRGWELTEASWIQRIGRVQSGETPDSSIFSIWKKNR